MKAEDVAKGLTEAMKQALLHPDGYYDPNTIRALRRRGLWKSALGEQVVALLTAPDNGEG